MTSGQMTRLKRLLELEHKYPNDEWFRAGEFDWDRPNANQRDLVRKGLIVEDVEHGYKFHLSDLGRQTIKESQNDDPITLSVSDSRIHWGRYQ